jgi:predicted SnoaL-like aldol condensation-catalyzing enzyme
MYAQLIEGGTTSGRRAELDRIVTDELIPALETEPGYAGAFNLANATSGDGVMIVLWQTEAQAGRPLAEYGAAFLKALAQIAAISTGNRRPITVWTVNAENRTTTATRPATEENKLIATRWFALINDDKVEELCELTAPTWRMHGGPPGLPSGPDGVRELMRAIGPIQQTWTIDDIIAEGDRVAVRATNDCVQESFLGISGQGQHQRFTATFTHRITDGRIQETWRNADDLGRALQLGARIEQARPAQEHHRWPQAERQPAGASSRRAGPSSALSQR